MSRILLVEDNQKVSGIIGKFLEKKGFDCDTSPDGISAIRSFVGQTYDLLLINLELSFMNGANVCRKIRESAKGKDLPIVMMSGALKNESEIQNLKRELRLTGFLTKPFTSDALFSLLSSALPVPAPRSASMPAAVPEQAAPAHVQPQPQPISDSHPEPQPRPLRGNLETTPFEQVLFYLLKKKATGVLTVARNSVIRNFFFIGGAAVDVQVIAGDDDFGSYLAARKLIDDVELREFRARQKPGGSDPREIFIKMGCLAPQQFHEENLQFLHARLVECFTWNSGTVHFEWDPSVIPQFPSAAAFMPVLFYRGFKSKLNADGITEFLGQKGRLYVGRAAEFYDYQNHFTAEVAGASGLLDRLDGLKTSSDVISEIDSDESAVILYTLDYLKLLFFTENPQKSDVLPPFPLRERATPRPVREPEKFEDLGSELSALADEVSAISAIQPAPAAGVQADAVSGLEQELKAKWESIKNKNYYEIFGVTQKTFTFEKLRKAYFEFMRNYGPDRFFASSSEVMALAEELLSKISNAYETLSNVVSKENYDEMLSSQEQAPAGADDREFYEQIQYQSGKVFVEQGQFASAERAFVNCVNINPDKPEYLAYLALAIYNNPAHKGNPAERKRAKDTVNRSLQLGKLSIAYALKGSMYLDEGSINFAEAEFNKALRLNPNNKTALKKLELIKAKREDEKKGLFQRMFK